MGDASDVGDGDTAEDQPGSSETSGSHPRPMPYPGWVDQQLLTPAAPLPPGAGVGVYPLVVPPSAAPAPCWAPDPTGRNEWRWWSGAVWTEHVANAGEATRDPLHGP